jgi:CubicO group peptidase (beta-lactamase class C family)
MPLIFRLVLPLALLAPATAQAQPPVATTSLDAAFELVARAIEHEGIPGAIALVAQHGKIVREQAFGVSHIESKTPFTPRTLCWIASITKPITVSAAMKLVEQGRIGLDDPVEKFLPEFNDQVDREGRHRPITVRQLMSHTSGIQANPPTRPSFFFESGWLGRNLGELPPLIAKTTLEFEPGGKVLYSNAAPYVLARIVELQSGQPFGDFLKQKILEPAGMHDTYFAVPATEAQRAANVCRDNRGERVVFCRVDPAWIVSMTMPDGGLFSSPRDIMKFLLLFLAEDSRVLAPESVRAMRTMQTPGWGLGWGLEEDGLFFHNGSSGTSAWADPRTGVIGILFFQVQNPQKTDPLQARFRQAVRTALANAATQP